MRLRSKKELAERQVKWRNLKEIKRFEIMMIKNG
jgi:hypothetical protein